MAFEITKEIMIIGRVVGVKSRGENGEDSVLQFETITPEGDFLGEEVKLVNITLAQALPFLDKTVEVKSIKFTVARESWYNKIYYRTEEMPIVLGDEKKVKEELGDLDFILTTDIALEGKPSGYKKKSLTKDKKPVTELKFSKTVDTGREYYQVKIIGFDVSEMMALKNKKLRITNITESQNKDVFGEYSCKTETKPKVI